MSRVDLPRRVANTRHDQGTCERLETPRGDRRGLGDHPRAPGRIAVGDSRTSRSSAQAESEAEALALLGGGEWDAVVLDLQLKQGTGLGVLKKLRQRRAAVAHRR